ncbi:hypothetical protein ACROSR_00905 [Roseovarius tibetensis]|uniref:hypothetical protein n=1 Tax=Roseovarius tibetensis TaxID=2685897 RepID=UPI003D7F4D72
MKRRVLFTTLMAVMLVPLFIGSAGAQHISASEIEDVLTGNTIDGVWSGSHYRQYYAEDGTTIYVPDEGQRREGRWRVNPEDGTYESWWRSTGWTPYVMVDLPDSGYAWINGDVVEAFTVQKGRRIE